MIIKNENLNIDSIIVQNCDNYNELYNWKEAVTSEIIHAKSRLEAYKANYITGQKQPVKWDYNWFVRVKKFKSLQGILLQQIQKRLGEVKRQNKTNKHRIKEEHECLFWKRTVKGLVDHETFVELCFKLEKLMKLREDETMEVKKPRKRIGSKDKSIKRV